MARLCCNAHIAAPSVSDAVRRTVPCHDVRVGVPASRGGMPSAVLPDVETRLVASLHVCIDYSPASQANPSKREANPSKREANPSKCQANSSKSKQTQNMPKQNEANAIYTDTDTDTDTVTDTVMVSHSLTRAREKQSATADCKESVPAVRHAPAPWDDSFFVPHVLTSGAGFRIFVFRRQCVARHSAGVAVPHDCPDKKNDQT